jgi:hypothetical protein
MRNNKGYSIYGCGDNLKLAENNAIRQKQLIKENVGVDNNEIYKGHMHIPSRPFKVKISEESERFVRQVKEKEDALKQKNFMRKFPELKRSKINLGRRRSSSERRNSEREN